MAVNPNTPYGESTTIYQIIEVLKEVERLHTAYPCISSQKFAHENVMKAQRLLDDAIEEVAENTTNARTGQKGVLYVTIKEKMKQQIINTADNNKFAFKDWFYYIVNWLTTSDKSQIKALLKANTSYQYHERDLIAINNW